VHFNSGDPAHLLVTMRNSEQLWGRMLHSLEEVALNQCHKLLLHNLANVRVFYTSILQMF